MNLLERYTHIKSQISLLEKRLGCPGTVRLLAVSKGQSCVDIKALSEVGQVDFAESYVQEAASKIAELKNATIVWHYIGRIQSNKLKEIARHFSWVHSVSSIKQACKLNELSAQNNKRLNICIQVNVTGSERKSGVTPEQLFNLIDGLSKFSFLNFRSKISNGTLFLSKVFFK